MVQSILINLQLGQWGVKSNQKFHSYDALEEMLTAAKEMFTQNDFIAMFAWKKKIPSAWIWNYKAQ